MPIYEFSCRECGATFEELVRGDCAVACPECHSADIRRLLSSFAVHSSSSGGGSGKSCSTCAATSCSTCH